jgi:hypothetical protein
MNARVPPPRAPRLSECGDGADRPQTRLHDWIVRLRHLRESALDNRRLTGEWAFGHQRLDGERAAQGKRHYDDSCAGAEAGGHVTV